MRYKPEHKKETHRRIVESASKEFRTYGFEGVGIAKLMETLDLTHGGFYAHFADKEELVAEAYVLALHQSLEMILQGLQTNGFPAVLDFYLGDAHRDNPAIGCPLPTLTSEIARHPFASREAFTKKLSETFESIVEYMPGKTREEKQEKVYMMFATMTGAVSLARAVTDPVLSDAILRSTRENLLRLIEGESK